MHFREDESICTYEFFSSFVILASGLCRRVFKGHIEEIFFRLSLKMDIKIPTIIMQDKRLGNQLKCLKEAETIIICKSASYAWVLEIAAHVCSIVFNRIIKALSTVTCKQNLLATSSDAL